MMIHHDSDSDEIDDDVALMNIMTKITKDNDGNYNNNDDIMTNKYILV